MRPKSVRRPNGRLDHYDYDTAGTTDPHADDLNRLHAIKDDNESHTAGDLASAFSSFDGAHALPPVKRLASSK